MRKTKEMTKPIEENEIESQNNSENACLCKEGKTCTCRKGQCNCGSDCPCEAGCCQAQETHVQSYLTDHLEQLKRLSLRWIIRRGFNLPEAEDLFQQSILKALTSKAELRENEKLQSWFMAILKNTLMDHIRSRNLHREKEISYQLEKDLFQEDPDVESSFCRCVNDFMQDLPAAERNLLQEHFLQGKTFAALSSEYGVTQASLRVKSLRAKEKLKKMFKACCKIRKFKDFADCDCG